MSGDGERILNWMREHGSITPLEALSFGCYRLSGMIFKLRAKGYDISTEMIYGRDMHGEPSSYAVYRLHE